MNINNEIESLFEGLDLDDYDLDTDFSDNMDENEQYDDISDKILKLNDKLSEEIIQKNIEEQMDGEVSPLDERINYLQAFKDKYYGVTEDDELFDKAAKFECLYNVVDIATNGLKKNYGIQLGDGIDVQNPETFLDKMTDLYEFLYVRNYQNLVDYFYSKIMTLKFQTYSYYEDLLNSEEHSKDVFVIQAKKKFKNNRDVVIIHFMNEIIKDIRDDSNSAYVLFEEIANLDIFEETNYNISEMLVNYGNDISIENDSEAAQMYMSILDNDEVFSSLKNDVMLKYLDSCEIEK